MSTDRIHLAIAVREFPDDTTLKTISTATGMTPYDLRLRLRSGLPKTVATLPTLAEAEEMAQRVQPLKVAAIVYAERSLPPRRPFPVRTIRREASGFTCLDKKGKRLDMPDEGIALLVHGRRNRITVQSRTVGKYTYQKGGVRVRLEEVKDKQTDAEIFLTLFPADPQAQAAECAAGAMDFTCLGKQMQLTDLMSMSELLKFVRGHLPQVPFDDRLLESGVTDDALIQYNRHSRADAAQAMATLVYWQHMAEAAGGCYIAEHSEDANDLLKLRRARSENAGQPGIPLEEIKKRFGMSE